MTNLITLAGEGFRFTKEGYKTPKPLIPINGTPMIFKAVDCLPKSDKYVFVCKTEHVEKYDLGNALSERYSNTEIITVDKTTKGQAFTAEIGIRQSSISNSDEVLISCCDYGLSYNEEKYNKIKNSSDIVVWSTINNKAFASNPASYSWLEVDSTKLLRVFVKQDIFSNPYDRHAIVGTFYFSKAKYFLDGVKTIREKNITSNSEHYIDNIFNTIENLNVNIFNINEYKCWGTPKDLENYEKQKKL